MYTARLIGYWSNSHFIAIVLHLGRTFNHELLFVNFSFYIFNQQRFRAVTTTIPALQKPQLVVSNYYEVPTYHSIFFNLL